MKRRTFIANSLAASLLITASPAVAGKLSLAEISNYFNKLKTAKGSFTQINPNGTKSKGIFYLNRPGKMRFEYQKPNHSLVIASSGSIAIFDHKSNTGPQQFPLSKTPLSIILAKHVNLAKSSMVYRHSINGALTSITARDPKRPKIGNIQLFFTANPTALRKWIVTDQSGKVTTVILGSLTKNLKLNRRLFDIDAITRQRKGKD